MKQQGDILKEPPLREAKTFIAATSCQVRTGARDDTIVLKGWEAENETHYG